MKTSTLAVLAAFGTAVSATNSTYSTPDCNMGAIQGKLLANGTTWHDSCTAATGCDVFKLSSFPTAAQAKQISQSRDCVNYINQINQEANSDIQCKTYVGDQSVNFAQLLTEFLTGKTGNTTKTTTVGSKSGSGSTSHKSSAGKSSKNATDSSHSTTVSHEKKASSGSTSAYAGSTQTDSSTKGSKSSSETATTAVSAVMVVSTALLAFAL